MMDAELCEVILENIERMSVSVCVCVRERDRDGERQSVFVCEKEWESERVCNIRIDRS